MTNFNEGDLVVANEQGLNFSYANTDLHRNCFYKVIVVEDDFWVNLEAYYKEGNERVPQYDNSFLSEHVTHWTRNVKQSIYEEGII